MEAGAPEYICSAEKLMKCYIHNLAIATLGYVHISLKLLIIELKEAQEQGKAEGQRSILASL